jgi:hypothetical protein
LQQHPSTLEIKMQEIDCDYLKERLEHLIDLAIIKKSATDAFNDAVKDASEKSGATKPHIKQLITAKINEDKEAIAEDTETLSTLIEQVL